MKRPFNHISLQHMSPAFVMKAGHDCGVYWTNRPRGPDVPEVRILINARSILIYKKTGKVTYRLQVIELCSNG